METLDRLHARPRTVLVELTSACNLRCVYCATSQPGHEGKDLEVDRDEWIEQVARLGPREVQISGHGDSTTLADWHVLASELMERGLVVTLTTHLARRLSRAELDVLSRMASVTVSCDTADADLYAKLRRGGRLRDVEANLEALAGRCRERGREPPYIGINAVVMDVTVAGLGDLARWAARMGAGGLSLVNLISYPQVEGAALEPVHPAGSNPRAALGWIEEARRVAGRLGLELNVMPGLELRLRRASEA